MSTFVIERDLPDCGAMSQEELEGIARTSNGVLAEMPDVEWVKSFVCDNKIFCIYQAPSENLIREHARRGNFPCNNVFVVRAEIDPDTGKK
jgi:hypothetical protein